ncbi:MAG: hypothetical protein CM15mP74_33710 [Halieaceae bacterium]|nr:MAG: hypothetical protein CM15mP74_33710 [Halieaceae bacterium]
MQRKTLINFILALSLTCLALPALAQLSEIDQSGLKVQPDLFARDSLRIDSIVCPFKNEVDYEPGDIECGLLEVPENREKGIRVLSSFTLSKSTRKWMKLTMLKSSGPNPRRANAMIR